MRLPPEVYDFVRTLFEDCNAHVARKIAHMPTSHETSLDMSLIEAISQHAPASHRVAPDWIVRLETHYLGGGRHFGQWEVADIGFIVVWRDRGKVKLRKVAILQSKRLYPDEQGLEEDTPLDYMIGFGRLMQGDEEDLAAQEERVFTFTHESRYRALVSGDDQYQAIEAYEARRAIPVHYLFYNPLSIPWAQRVPVTERKRFPRNDVGVQVIRARALQLALRRRQGGYTPTYADVAGLNPWRLEVFVADELLRCRQGYRAKGPNDDGLVQVFSRRTGPISTAIGITIDRVSPGGTS